MTKNGRAPGASPELCRLHEILTQERDKKLRDEELDVRDKMCADNARTNFRANSCCGSADPKSFKRSRGSLYPQSGEWVAAVMCVPKEGRRINSLAPGGVPPSQLGL